MPREIKFGSRTFADPGPDFTPQEIQSALAQFYPELANATPQTDEHGNVTFVVKGGTKGAGG